MYGTFVVVFFKKKIKKNKIKDLIVIVECIGGSPPFKGHDMSTCILRCK